MNTYLHNKMTSAEWVEFIVERKPNSFLTLALNDSAWHCHDRGGKAVSMDTATKLIQRAALTMDKKALGGSAEKHPEDRMGLIMFPEKPDELLHYHGFIWYPNVRDTFRGRAFSWVWFEEEWKATWTKIVPGGSVNLQSLRDQPDPEPGTRRAASYTLKNAHQGHALANFVISPASGPMPQAMLQGTAVGKS